MVCKPYNAVVRILVYNFRLFILTCIHSVWTVHADCSTKKNTRKLTFTGIYIFLLQVLSVAIMICKE